MVLRTKAAAGVIGCWLEGKDRHLHRNLEIGYILQKRSYSEEAAECRGSADHETEALFASLPDYWGLETKPSAMSLAHSFHVSP